MEEFIDAVSDIRLRNRLINALNRAKPFRNFKYEVDNAGEYRPIWFDFKDQKYFEWLKDQIETMNFNDED